MDYFKRRLDAIPYFYCTMIITSYIGINNLKYFFPERQDSNNIPECRIEVDISRNLRKEGCSDQLEKFSSAKKTKTKQNKNKNKRNINPLLSDYRMESIDSC